jgi:3-isopropylmalate dehydrogenase
MSCSIAADVHAGMLCHAARVHMPDMCSPLPPAPLQVSQLWKEVVIRVGKEYPEVELSHMYIDNAAMQMIRNPKWFDTIVTGELRAEMQ